MAYFITDDCKDLIKDIRNFCDNEMKEQVYEAEKLGYSDEAAADEIIMEILGGIQEMGIGTLPIPEESGGPGL